MYWNPSKRVGDGEVGPFEKETLVGLETEVGDQVSLLEGPKDVVGPPQRNRESLLRHWQVCPSNQRSRGREPHRLGIRRRVTPQCW